MVSHTLLYTSSGPASALTLCTTPRRSSSSITGIDSLTKVRKRLMIDWALSSERPEDSPRLSSRLSISSSDTCAHGNAGTALGREELESWQGEGSERRAHASKGTRAHDWATQAGDAWRGRGDAACERHLEEEHKLTRAELRLEGL